MANPNILVILCDQLKRRALGCYGDPNVSTPNLDSLADKGAKFSNACSSFPVCVPFRFSLMTGEYAHSRFVPAIEWRMSPAERTLADEFNDANYDTIYCGKWHLYGGHGLLPNHNSSKANLTRVPPAFQGRWKKWFGFDVSNDPFNTWYFEDDSPEPKLLPGYQTDELFDLTMNHLENRPNKETPFFCVLSVEPPHFPLIAPEKFTKKWQDKPIQLPENFLFSDQYPTPGNKINQTQKEEAIANLKTYYAMIENLDWNVGRIMSFLKASGLDQNTTVVFLSDHGQMDGSHSETSTIKQHPYEESIGIPLIIADPNMPDKNGLVVADPVSTEDLFPTLLGLAGLMPRDPKPGLNMAPAIRQEKLDVTREGVLLEFVHELRSGPNFPYHENYWRGFRSEHYKYTVLGNARDGGKPWQFYDLQNDPCEMNNLINDQSQQDLIKHYHTLMRNRMIETNDHYVLAQSFNICGLNLWSDR